MGPLFSAGLVIVVLALGSVGTYFIVRLFYKPSLAILVAPLFMVGFALGAAGAGLTISVFIGVGGTLTSPLQVAAYLSALTAGGTLAGSALVWLYKKMKRSN